MGEVVCATEATHIIGQHNPLVFAVYHTKILGAYMSLFYLG